MSRLVRAGAPLLVAAAMFGCAPSPIGDPCVPESIPTGGYDFREVYIETSSVQCRTRACMVYQLQGNPAEDCVGEDCADPAAVDNQIFCTCRCSTVAGASSNTPLCTCGEGFTCIDDVVTAGGEGVRGGYCVPCSTPENPLPSPPFADCPTAS